MKNKKRMIVVLCLFLGLTAFGCQKKQEAPKWPDRDVDYPSEVAKLNEDSVQIHYQRADNAYSGWTLWLWDPEGEDDGLEDDFNYQDDFGVIASYPLSRFGSLSGGRLGVIVKTKGSWTKDGTDADRFIEFGGLKKDENGVYHVYLVGGDEHMYESADLQVRDEIKTARFMTETSIQVIASNPIETFRVYKDDVMLEEASGAGRSRFSYQLKEPASLESSYRVETVFRGSGTTLGRDVDAGGLYITDAFNEKYYFDGELGALYTPEKTEFRVWSPVSSRIVLKVYENGTPKRVSSSKGSDKCDEYEMEKGEKGVFRYTLEGDQEGRYYTYMVYNAKYPEGIEVVDPYAKGAGVSGLRGMVVNFDKTDPEGWNQVSYLTTDRKRLTVWETHVADVTSSDTWGGSEANQRKYLGMIEEGTTYTENGVTVTTGFDHIKELGVNAVQLQPVFDQDNDETSYVFNWGYNPLNYNVPEGMYSSDPYDGYTRIRELKQVVQSFNKAGITVIMDVVYNHVSDAGTSNLNILMPDYYFRYNNDGSYSNGSGCGNETASENPMMRKFIIDSVVFWTKEYKLGGFRFDLMGLHDLQTMEQVVAAARTVNPDIVIYGEPWTGGTTPLSSDKQAKQANGNSYNGYGQFNDQMRDGLIKGGLHGPTETGWVTGNTFTQGDINAISAGINGFTVSCEVSIEDADKTVSYVTCHDNYTLYDRCRAAGIDDEETLRKMCVLANSVVFTSGGTAFMLAGEEMLRTKKGDANSYRSSDEVNQLDYALKVKNLDVFKNYQKLIAFKKNTSRLAQKDPAISVETLGGGAGLYYSFESDGREYIVIHVNGAGISDTVDVSGCTVVLDTLGQYSGAVNEVKPQPYQTLVLAR